MLANAGHFDVEIDLDALRARPATTPRGAPARRAVRRRRPAAEPARPRARREPRRRRGPPGGGHGHLLRDPGARVEDLVAARELPRRPPGARRRSTARSRGSSSPRSAWRSTRSRPTSGVLRGWHRRTAPSVAALDDARRSSRRACARRCLRPTTRSGIGRPSPWRAGQVEAPRRSGRRDGSSRASDGPRAKRRRCARRVSDARSSSRPLRAAGETGMIPEAEIEPVERLPDADDAARAGDGRATLLDRTVVLKLNGGLGTSMGMTRAKSLLAVKDGLTFLDIIAAPGARRCASATARALPLVLMNSLRARARTRWPRSRATASSTADVAARLRPEQGAEAARRRPAARRAGRPTPTLEWARPGHGDLYPALVRLRHARARCSSRGYRYAFVSNSDNLGAVLDPRILAWFAREEMPVPDGGRRPHRGRPQGRPPRAAAATAAASCCARSRRRRRRTWTPSRTSTRHRYFNTNNLWVDLRALRRGAARARRRARPADDRQPQDRRPRRPASSPAVIQLETAMGAAIERLRRAPARCASRGRASRRSRRRTTCSSLRSDAYVLRRAPARELAPAARRGRRSSTSTRDYYKLVGRLRGALPGGRAVARRAASALDGARATSCSARTSWCAGR